MSDREGHGTDSKCYNGLHQSGRRFREEHVRGILLQDRNLGQSTASARRSNRMPLSLGTKHKVPEELP